MDEKSIMLFTIVLIGLFSACNPSDVDKSNNPTFIGIIEEINEMSGKSHT